MDIMWKRIFKISLAIIVIVAIIYIIVGTFFSGGKSTNTNFDGFGNSVAKTPSSTKSTDDMEVALDKILINMQKGEFRYMKADMSLKAASPSDKEALQDSMPRVRDMILRFSSNQDSDDLMSNEGKQEYKAQLKEMLRDTMDINVEDVYFRDFVLAR